MRLSLVRHAESTWNVEGRYQGRKDPPLSPLGLEQAQALALRLQSENSLDPIARIVSSPLRRAYDTAFACAQATGVALTVDDRLIEISHGQWEGLLRSEVKQRWPALYAQWQAAPQSVRFPDGESLQDVQARFTSFLNDQTNLDGRTLAVTHDVIVRLGVLMALNKPLSEFHTVRIDNASLSEFELEGGVLRAIIIDDVTHVAALRSNVSMQAL